MTIYTAIFGPYEELKEPTVITPGWKYICYTDQPLISKIWEIHRFFEPATNPVMDSRHYKIRQIPDGKSIWVDGSFVINCDLNEWWEANFTSPMTVIQHPMRNCVFKEFAACITNGRASDVDLRKQRKQYLQEGVFDNKGVIQSGILMRENTPEIAAFHALWWKQLTLSTRDQIGFAFAEWKMKVKWPRIQYDYRTGQQFKFITHYNRRKHVPAP